MDYARLPKFRGRKRFWRLKPGLYIDNQSFERKALKKYNFLSYQTRQYSLRSPQGLRMKKYDSKTITEFLITIKV